MTKKFRVEEVLKTPQKTIKNIVHETDNYKSAKRYYDDAKKKLYPEEKTPEKPNEVKAAESKIGKPKKAGAPKSPDLAYGGESYNLTPAFQRAKDSVKLTVEQMLAGIQTGSPEEANAVIEWLKSKGYIQ